MDIGMGVDSHRHSDLGVLHTSEHVPLLADR
ncbi:hypothetical protein N599_36030 [Saccharopolyspora erythraea D]|nr:hypothetical protein N599_36030 [Saccharopolyspora erythraea D]